MNLIGQDDEKGCGVACCAMVCGQGYAEAKAKVSDHCWGGQFTHYDAFEYLNLHGFSYQHWYKHARFVKPEKDTFPVREPWPPPLPIAAAHIILTRGDAMGHWVAMDEKGEVFDPIRGRGRRIGDYDVMQVIGIWKVPTEA